MKKSLTIALVAAFVMSAGASAMAANTSSDNKVVAAGKKVCTAVCWPFKKLGEGCKAVGSKITGK
jgi:hypothetical protein